MTDFATRRAIMVDSQIRPNDITKFPVIEALLHVPREEFVPEAWREAAYVSENIPLAPGRVLFEPRTFGKMLDTLDIQPDELVLDIGCGLGYSAAVMSRLAVAVVAVEENEAFAAEAQAALAAVEADNVVLHQGPLAEGAEKHGPYDVVFVEGAVAVVPEGIVAQMKEGGRIICLFQEGALGTVRIGRKIDGRIGWRHAFNASAPVVSGFEKQAAFTL